VLAKDSYYDSQLEKDFLHMLNNGEIRTVFQPIVSLRTGQVVGYEALSRGPQNSPLENPSTLFSLADRLEKTWELEYLCRLRAIERFAAASEEKLLFININPKIIEDSRFSKGFTKEKLTLHGIEPSRVIFEITEKNSITNYQEFCRILHHYTAQGFRVAIDDMGSGYSGLNLLANTRPQFVKIDLELIRSIDQDTLKQNLIKFFLEFSQVTGITLIAEGIETFEELKTLIQLGIEYGQGYYLQRPTSELTQIDCEKRKAIDNIKNQINNHMFKCITTIPVGEIVRSEIAIPPETTCSEVDEIFRDNPQLMGLAVVKKGVGIGLIMRYRFYGKLGTRYGFSIYSRRPISLVMDNFPLILDYSVPLEEVSRLAMARSNGHLYDYILVKLGDRHMGIVTVKDLLEKTTQLEVTSAKYANPLTGLPGNVIIESQINRVINEEEDYAVLYIDIDNFKAYNDVYSFQKGDEILKLTASILEEAFSSANFQYSFVGHIGGDDFVVIIAGGQIEEACKQVLNRFDRQVLPFYNHLDRERKYITTLNRKGNQEVFPLMSLSIAVITNKCHQFAGYNELAKIAAELKKKCKAINGSCYLVS